MLWSRKKPKEPKRHPDGLPPMPETVYLARAAREVDWKRLLFLCLGGVLFVLVYFSPPWPSARNVDGSPFPLTPEGKTSLALVLLALTWWIFEVVPVGITGITIGVVQALFGIRDPKAAFEDFLHPSVWFIFGSLVIGLVFTKTGLTKRAAYRMLALAGERTTVIFLGCMLLTAGLAHLMPHTAAAASIFPLLRAVYVLYEDENRPTRFGKGLFMGMAFTCGAGSIVTLLGSARSPLGLGFFQEMTGREILFPAFSHYLLPLGWTLVLVLCGYLLLLFRPEKKTIPGLRQRAQGLYARLGPMSAAERAAVVVVLATVVALAVLPFTTASRNLDKTGILLVSTILFFVLRILTVKDLQDLPWNLVLFFGGAMSAGSCLVRTGAADWLALSYIQALPDLSPLALLAVTVFLVFLTINWMMNVAVVAIAIPVGLAVALRSGISPEVMLFALLAVAGTPFLLLYGSAPNVIAYGSGQFSQAEFFRVGVGATLLFALVLASFVLWVWPPLGLPLLSGP